MDPSYQGDTRDAMLPSPTSRNALEGCPAMIMLLADSHRQGRMSKQHASLRQFAVGAVYHCSNVARGQRLREGKEVYHAHTVSTG